MKKIASCVLPALAVMAWTPAAVATAQGVRDYKQHDLERTQPTIVTPGTFGSQDMPGKPPSDAIVLFDGTSLDAWKSSKTGGSAPWKVESGYFEIVPDTGGIETKRSFGDVQLHVEFATPTPPKGEGQDRGNSGVFFGAGRYEVQVLDSYGNKTYPDGQAGALYGQYPPLVNASLPPGKWQVYDVVYEAPRFDDGGQVMHPARLTVFHNGVLVQHARELIGPTANKSRPPYEAHPVKLPISLQDHDHPTRFRNIWVRELEPLPPPK